MGRKGTGRWLLSSVAALTSVGGFLYRLEPDAPPLPAADARPSAAGSRAGQDADRVRLPVRLGSFAFPGVGGLESEFPEKIPRVGDVWLNECFFGAGMLTLLAAGYAAGRGGDRAWGLLGNGFGPSRPTRTSGTGARAYGGP